MDCDNINLDTINLEVYYVQYIFLIFKYIFIVIIYLFILSIIRLIYLDIRGISQEVSDGGGRYLKLINKKNTLSFNVKEYYPVEDIISIGRSGNNKIVLKDPYISKNHLKIVEDEGGFLCRRLKFC